MAKPPIPRDRIITPDMAALMGWRRLRHLEREAGQIVARAGPGWFHGVDPVTGEETPEGRQVHELVAAAVTPRRRGHGVRVDPAFLAEVLAAWEAGKSTAKLAAHYGVAPRTVARWLARARKG